MSTPNQFVEYGRVPPEILIISAVPSLPPLQLTSVLLLISVNGFGSLIKILFTLVVQPFASVTE